MYDEEGSVLVNLQRGSLPLDAHDEKSLKTSQFLLVYRYICHLLSNSVRMSMRLQRFCAPDARHFDQQNIISKSIFPTQWHTRMFHDMFHDMFVH